ncbi:MAG: hypothetical protein K2N56_00205 [Oscillospiraceae bacterium]|nr:hypothetical protein [Oscillospiraceae bacterium]
MSIIEKIFLEYLDGNFRVKPDIRLDRERWAKIRKFKESLALSENQAEKFDQLLFEICCDYQQPAFLDGFRTAFDLMLEVIG